MQAYSSTFHLQKTSEQTYSHQGVSKKSEWLLAWQSSKVDLLRPEVSSGHLKSVMLPHSGYQSLLWNWHYTKKSHTLQGWKLQSTEKNTIWGWKFFLILKIASGFRITCFGSLNIIPFSHEDKKKFVVISKTYYFNKRETTWHCVSQLEILILLCTITIIFSKCIVFKEHLVFPGYLFYIACFFLKSITPFFVRCLTF